MKHLVLLMIMAGGLALHLSGQTSQNPMDFSYEVTAHPNNYAEANGDTLFHYEAIINLSDPDSIKKIHVKMGTQEGGSSVLSHNFIFDKNCRLPKDLGYHRDSNVVKLILGKHYPAEYFYQIKLEDKSSNMTSANTQKGRYHSKPIQ